MPKLRVCAEIKNAGQDEIGNPIPVGVQIELGEVTEEWMQEHYDEYVTKIWSKVTPEDFLNTIGLRDVFSPDDCRIISAEEYDRIYGEE